MARTILHEERSSAPAEAPSAAPFVPSSDDLATLAGAVQNCRGCDLYRHATQAVFGEGPRRAHVFLIGEQPGDQEDRQGKPFVGPSGKMLDRALEDASVDRASVYVSNAVKHFRFVQRGKIRFHQKPSSVQIRACHPWLEAELEIVRPEVIVCLGATAAQSLLQHAATITPLRGRLHTHSAGKSLIVTVHPSSLLRAPDEETRRVAYQAFVRDLKLIAIALRH